MYQKSSFMQPLLKVQTSFMSSVLQLWKLLVELHLGIVCHSPPNHSPERFNSVNCGSATKQHLTLGMNLQSLCRNFV